MARQKAAPKKKAPRKKAAVKKPEDKTPEELTEEVLAEVEEEKAEKEAKPEPVPAAAPGLPDKSMVTVNVEGKRTRMSMAAYKAMQEKGK